MWKRSYICIALLLLLGLSLTCSKSMWGSRRKKDQEANTLQETKPKISKQTMSSKPASTARDTPKPKKRRTSASVEPFDEGTIDNVREVFDAYLKIVEDLLESDDFHTVVNPDSVMTMMSQVPGYTDNEQMQAIFSSPEFNDPELLKATVGDGVRMLRVYSEEILDTFRDPVKFSVFLEQLSPEMVELIRGLKSGDTSILMDFIDALPGIEEKQKSMLKSLLNGDTTALTNEINDILGDPDKVEALRLEFLQNPEMIEAVGLTSDVVEDPQQWATFFAEGLQQMNDAVASEQAPGEELNSFSAGMSGSSGDVIKRMRDSDAVSDELKKLRRKMQELNRAA